MNISGIYKIQSTIKPERIYIGSASNINRRWNCHLHKLRSRKHHSSILQHHYNKYGESDLQFLVLLGCDKEELIKVEQFFLDVYNPWFNICKTAYSLRGYVHKEVVWNKGDRDCISEETRQKLRDSHKGQKSGMEGKHHTERSKLNMSKSHIGQIAWNRGKCMSIEAKQKHIKLMLSDEYKIKKSEGLKKWWALRKFNNN